MNQVALIYLIRIVNLYTSISLVLQLKSVSMGSLVGMKDVWKPERKENALQRYPSPKLSSATTYITKYIYVWSDYYDFTQTTLGRVVTADIQRMKPTKT
jgi:hypothetical protein